MRVRPYESVIEFRFVISRKISRPATFDFCNSICQRRTFGDAKESKPSPHLG
jgi:hypothetical protein